MIVAAAVWHALWIIPRRDGLRRLSVV